VGTKKALRFVASRPRFGGDSQAFSWVETSWKDSAGWGPAGEVQLDRDQLDRKGFLMSISIRALPR